jgi:hypothetical protein
MANVCEKRIVLVSFRYLDGCDELLDGGFSSWTVFGRDMFKLEIPTVMFFRKTDAKFEFKPAISGQYFPNTVFIFKLGWKYRRPEEDTLGSTPKSPNGSTFNTHGTRPRVMRRNMR